MAHAERVDETFKRNFARRRAGIEQVAHRDFAEALLLLEPDLVVARFQRKNVGRLLDPTMLEEQGDLLLAQPLDIERAARDEVPQMLDLLMRAGEFAAAMGTRDLHSPRYALSHHGRLHRPAAARRN